MHWSSSVSLSNDQILIVGSELSSYYQAVALYNPGNDTWKSLKKAASNKRRTKLVLLGARIFSIAGVHTNDVEEYTLENDTWKAVDAKLKNRYNGAHSVLAIPADMFSNITGGVFGCGISSHGVGVCVSNSRN